MLKLPTHSGFHDLFLNSNKLYKKKKRNPKYKEQYQKTKTKLQNEMRNSYWRYIENMIFDIEINEPDQPSFKNTPKKLYSYIKSQKNENTGIAPLRSEGTLHSHPSEKAKNTKQTVSVCFYI
jgi:hypothetical protein